MDDAAAARSLALPRLRWLPQLSVDMDPPRVTLHPNARVVHVSAANRVTRWRRCVEDMELLALAWLVDPHAWREIINAQNSDAIRGGVRTNDSTTPTYLITLPSRDTSTHEQMRANLEAVFAPIDDSERSDAPFHQHGQPSMADNTAVCGSPEPVAAVPAIHEC